LKASTPLIISAINLILRGEVGALLRYAVEGPVLAASLIALSFARLATDPLIFFSVSIARLII
jgi:hypothetical protein